AGTYIPVYPYNEILLEGKNITLMGVNPDDPNVVASTILIDYHLSLYNVGPETIIEGITFQDADLIGATMVNASQAADDGVYGVTLYGAAIYMANASPTIRNCNFDGCYVEGGNGANGDGGNEEHPIGFDGGWAGGAYGGAVYLGYLSSPVFENCAFTDCYVAGGVGGDGGPGYQGTIGGRGGSWEWSESIEEQIIAYGWDGWEWGPYAEYWKYSGYGGAVYCSSYTTPRFVDCLFEGNQAIGSVSGVGGSTDFPPNRPLNVESFGGAVYIESFSEPDFTGCVFRNNTADANDLGQLDDIYISFGGSVAFEDNSSPTFTNCVFEENNAAVGGGLWWSNATATITDCNFVANNAYHGGAMYAVDSNGVIDNTIVQRNLAFLTTVDANLVADPNVGFGGVMSWGGGLCAINSPMSVYNSVFTENRAQSSGGGLYLAGSDQDITTSPIVHNCLIYNNSAGRDGGGISTWKSEPVISNCTVADNIVTGALGVAYGGGLFVAYDSNAVMIDSIIWGNTSSQEGSQIAVANGFEYGARPSTLHLTHTDVQSDVDPNAVAGTALDLVFVIDSTDSMTDYVNAVEAMASEIVEAATEVVPDYRIAIVDYKDFNDTTIGAASDYPFRVVAEFSEDASRAINAFSSIGTPAGAGGNTDAESIYTALANTIDGTALGGWRSGDVKRVIILITDAPPHDPETLTGLSLADVVGAASEAPSKRIFAVQIGDDALASVYLTNLAGATGGAVVRVPLDDLTATTGGTTVNAANPIGEAVIEAIGQISSVASSIFVSGGSLLPGWDAETGTWDPATANLMEDPLFIAGFYLSQVDAGQGRQSPAVDAGSGPADATTIALADRTTRTDGVGDANEVDLGYHYAEGVTLLALTAEVLADPNDGLIHGTVTPTYTLIYEGAADNIIRLTAVPEEGYTVSQW
ncbi:right-handed parallel beta-helix repeat-containing protein, partial [archaeon]|nr:right-handed parallel beta-helix repeat-containing protein [archaeon]